MIRLGRNLAAFTTGVFVALAFFGAAAVVEDHGAAGLAVILASAAVGATGAGLVVRARRRERAAAWRPPP